MLRFTRELIALRRRHLSLTANRFFTGVPGRGRPDVVWHGASLSQPAWDDPLACLLAFTLAGLSDDEEDLHVILNMAEDGFEAPLPDPHGRRWHLAIDTRRTAPEEIVAREAQTPLDALRYPVGAHNLSVFEAR